MKNHPIKNTNTARCEHGFSLVELIIVLLVISILSVLTLMAFKGDKKFLADSEAYSIMDILKRLTLFSAILAVSIAAQSAQAQVRDAGAKARGDYNFYQRGSTPSFAERDQRPSRA